MSNIICPTNDRTIQNDPISSLLAPSSPVLNVFIPCPFQKIQQNNNNNPPSPPSAPPPHASTHRQTSQGVSFSSLFSPSIGVVPAEVIRGFQDQLFPPSSPRAPQLCSLQVPTSSLGVHLPSRVWFASGVLGHALSGPAWASLPPSGLRSRSRAVLILALPCLLDDAICSRAQRATSTG